MYWHYSDCGIGQLFGPRQWFCTPCYEARSSWSSRIMQNRASKGEYCGCSAQTHLYALHNTLEIMKGEERGEKRPSEGAARTTERKKDRHIKTNTVREGRQNERCASFRGRHRSELNPWICGANIHHALVRLRLLPPTCSTAKHDNMFDLHAMCCDTQQHLQNPHHSFLFMSFVSKVNKDETQVTTR